MALIATLVAPIPAASLANDHHGGKTFLAFYLMLHAKFITTQEEAVPNGKGRAGSLYNAQILMPTPGSSTKKALRSLRNQLPKIEIWQAKGHPQIVHFADRSVLRWKGNPLDRKITFHGNVSVAYLESHVFAKGFPKVHFFNLGSGGSGGGSSVISLPRQPSLFTAPMHIDVRGVTLRHFLTSSMRYNLRLGPATGRQLWQAQFAEGRNGKFTGRVDIFITADPIVPRRHTNTKPQPGARGKKS
jgi:hypothetical protein